MKVNELIKELKKYPKDLVIDIRNHSGYSESLVKEQVYIVEWPDRKTLHIGG